MFPDVARESSCAGPASFASPAARRDSGTTLPFWMSPWFRPGIQLQSCSEQTNGVPASRRHPLRRFSNGFLPKPLHKAQIGQVNGRTAGGRAYSFARRGTSAVCLDVYKVRRLRANSLQICAKRELLKNNLVTAEEFAGSLDTMWGEPLKWDSLSFDSSPLAAVPYSLFPAFTYRRPRTSYSPLATRAIASV
jgi:hypothetical protein